MNECSDKFQGFLGTQCVCNICSARGDLKINSSKSLSLEIADVYIIDINSAIKAFCKEEFLGESEGWFCSVCGRQVISTKQHSFLLLPRVLIVHLKRFVGLEKENKHISFELLLDIEEQSWSIKYELVVGVIQHVSLVDNRSINVGHYNAYINSLIISI